MFVLTEKFGRLLTALYELSQIANTFRSLRLTIRKPYRLSSSLRHTLCYKLQRLRSRPFFVGLTKIYITHNYNLFVKYLFLK